MHMDDLLKKQSAVVKKGDDEGVEMFDCALCLSLLAQPLVSVLPLLSSSNRSEQMPRPSQRRASAPSQTTTRIS